MFPKSNKFISLSVLEFGLNAMTRSMLMASNHCSHPGFNNGLTLLSFRFHYYYYYKILLVPADFPLNYSFYSSVLFSCIIVR